jgi:hypothetical protein
LKYLHDVRTYRLCFIVTKNGWPEQRKGGWGGVPFTAVHFWQFLILAYSLDEKRLSSQDIQD